MTELDAVAIAEAVRRGDRSAVDVLDTCVERIEAANRTLGAFVHLDLEAARAAASAVDAMVAKGEDPGPLAGIPIGVKDLEDCAGMPTRHGSRLHVDAPPAAADGTHVARLRAAGAVPVGKTSTPEFGLIGMTVSDADGATRNPWNLATNPGGSSGGSAAAVAGGLVPLATGGDGGGSIRIPASFSGLVGLKVSHGRIPHHRFPNEMATLGVMATSVREAARHLDVTAGPDGWDPQALPAPDVRYEDVVETLDVSGLRVAWSSDLGFAVVDPEVEALARAAADDLVGSAGMERVELDVQLPLATPAWVVLASTKRRDRLILEGVWPDRSDLLDRYTRSTVLASERLTARDRALAAAIVEEAHRRVVGLFRDVDVILTPTTAVASIPATGPMPKTIAGRDAVLSGAVPFTQWVNLTWLPAVSVPAGLTRDGHPVGLQIVGRWHADDVVLRLARILEQARPWPRLAPPLPAEVRPLPDRPAGDPDGMLWWIRAGLQAGARDVDLRRVVVSDQPR